MYRMPYWLNMQMCWVSFCSNISDTKSCVALKHYLGEKCSEYLQGLIVFQYSVSVPQILRTVRPKLQCVLYSGSSVLKPFRWSWVASIFICPRPA